MVKKLSDFSWRYVLWRTDRNNDCLEIGRAHV